ncbi:hypothetical protein M9H77_03306 [Catharanthus roseus]|uniref:Uncharacterized protein n=1 Tax=Catharanthus roseus TaxID=4058 RepID=A0ACC0CBC0_CATRO|nr:hypothetical protein M9H77_03306 [Catharanthus roseus]
MQEFIHLTIKDLMTMCLLMDTMTCQFKILIHFMKVDTKEGNLLDVEEEDTIDHKKSFQYVKLGMKKKLFEDYGENPTVGQAYYGGYHGGQQVDKALDKIKWKVPNFKGESDLNVFLDWERQVDNLFMVRNYIDTVKVKLVIAELIGYALYWEITNQLELYPYTTYGDMCHLASKIENQRKKIDFSKANIPSSRSMVHKPKASTYKSWPKKDETPKVVFKDSFKPKVEEKGRLITNPTRSFKCNGVDHAAINYPGKRTLVFSKDLNGCIEKDEDDCQEDMV